MEVFDQHGEAGVIMVASLMVVAEEAKPLTAVEALPGSPAFIKESLVVESTGPFTIASVSPIGTLAPNWIAGKGSSNTAKAGELALAIISPINVVAPRYMVEEALASLHRCITGVNSTSLEGHGHKFTTFAGP